MAARSLLAFSATGTLLLFPIQMVVAPDEQVYLFAFVLSLVAGVLFALCLYAKSGRRTRTRRSRAA